MRHRARVAALAWMMRHRTWLLALAAAVVAAVAAAVAIITVSPVQVRSTLTGNQVVATRDGTYKIQNNEWDSSARESITTDLGQDFTVASSSISNASNGAPGGFPSIRQGCHWGNCSGGPLAAHPVREGTGVTSSWSTTQPGGNSVYDVVYDNWFNSAPVTSHQPDCAELMVWLNHNGPIRPIGSQAGSATIHGTTYNVWFAKQSWATISYVMTRPATSVSNLNIGDLARNAVSRGYLPASCYLISVEAGFELWRGGQGLAANSFSVTINGNGD